jgi:putative hydrolases of HD superfamily
MKDIIAFMTKDQKSVLDFIKLIDQMKGIERLVNTNKGLRQENDAEHSWHIAMMVWLFSSFNDKKINLEKALKMALMHDLVEIYAGDTFAYDHEARKTKHIKENLAAKKLFKILPKKLKGEMEKLWEEHEALITHESKFVQAMDKLQPILQNILDNGKSWKQYKITEKMVRDHKTHYNEGNQLLMDLFNYLLKEATTKKTILPKSA